MPKRSPWGARDAAIAEEVAGFCRASLEPALAARADRDEFPREALRRCGELGLLGLPVPPEFGGKGATCESAAAYLEAFGYSCQDNGLAAAAVAHLAGCVVPIWRVGTEAQKKRLLPPLCRGEWVGALAMTEPEAGSDILNIATVAEPEGDGYALHGRKSYVLNAPVADVVLVIATVKPGSGAEGMIALAVERGTPGMRVGNAVRKAGLRSAPMAELVFERCVVPAENRLGAVGGGAFVFHAAMLWERTLALAPHVGVMARVLERCIAHARARRQFGQSIGKFQAVSHRIAEMKLRLEAARMFLFRAAESLQRGARDPMDASMAKLFISEAAVQTYTDAVRIHGAAGYTEDLEFVEDLRDGLGTLILSGTSDIQREIIARTLGL